MRAIVVSILTWLALYRAPAREGAYSRGEIHFEEGR